MRRRWRQTGVPKHLGVVMGVQVYEAWRENESRQVDDRRIRAPTRRTDRSDHAIFDFDVGHGGGCTRAVDDGRASEHHMRGRRHCTTPYPGASSSPSISLTLTTPHNAM